MLLELAVRKLRTATIADFRRVVCVVNRGSNIEHIVLTEEAEVMRQACQRLHVDPGVNPHNGNRAQPAWEIRIEPLDKVNIAKLRPAGPYWWSTPDLQENYDSRGAVVFEVLN